jgi:hypothetical protein
VLNLSAKSLLRPFQKTLKRDGTEVTYSLDDFEEPDLEDETAVVEDGDDDDNLGEEVDILVQMTVEERELALEQMKAVRETISKVSFPSPDEIVLILASAS